MLVNAVSGSALLKPHVILTNLGCGNTIINGGGPAPDGSTGCNMACKGNNAEVCGGPNRLSVYSSTPSTSTGPVMGKRGLAYTNATQANLMKGYPKITWGYNWGYPSNGLDSSIEFVPMLWGLPSGADPGWDAAVKTAGTKNLLTFNEPDLAYGGSSNIAPAVAAAGWPAYLEPYAGTVGISLPNVLYNREMPNQFNPWVSQGLTWDLQFDGNCTSNPAGSCHSDFAGIHIYTDCSLITDFQGNVTQAWNVLQKPIWITELSCSGTDAEVITFLQAVMPWLDAQSFVARYAYFGVFNTVAGGTPFLLNSDGTGLSDLGMVYATG
jgi:hypothetical protein